MANEIKGRHGRTTLGLQTPPELRNDAAQESSQGQTETVSEKPYNQIEDLQNQLAEVREYHSMQIEKLQAQIREQEHELLAAYRVIARNFVQQY